MSPSLVSFWLFLTCHLSMTSSLTPKSFYPISKLYFLQSAFNSFWTYYVVDLFIGLLSASTGTCFPILLISVILEQWSGSQKFLNKYLSEWKMNSTFSSSWVRGLDKLGLDVCVNLGHYNLTGLRTYIQAK